ncbi:hypothetical protein [Agrobacterium sp. DSM 25558]|uniref:hypothetical protein n=1 Tax=Agrobacterium sp. DSM 25558 TaxID=1907665 RepID=UPI0011780ACB|nr:hypothetical protein [Agrobacterium sp. DSM 25558]
MPKLREPEARLVALRIAALSPNGEVSTAEIKEKFPKYRSMSPEDLIPSTTRSNEHKWEQIVGNVISHKNSSTSIFKKGLAERTLDGIKITNLGLSVLKAKKLI